MRRIKPADFGSCNWRIRLLSALRVETASLLLAMPCWHVDLVPEARIAPHGSSVRPPPLQKGKYTHQNFSTLVLTSTALAMQWRPLTKPQHTTACRASHPNRIRQNGVEKDLTCCTVSECRGAAIASAENLPIHPGACSLADGDPRT
jgi:hypothetical protein